MMDLESSESGCTGPGLPQSVIELLNLGIHSDRCQLAEFCTSLHNQNLGMACLNNARSSHSTSVVSSHLYRQEPKRWKLEA